MRKKAGKMDGAPKGKAKSGKACAQDTKGKEIYNQLYHRAKKQGESLASDALAVEHHSGPLLQCCV